MSAGDTAAGCHDQRCLKKILKQAGIYGVTIFNFLAILGRFSRFYEQLLESTVAVFVYGLVRTLGI